MIYPSINKGSAKKLEGNIYVITFFVSETPWPLNEKMTLFKEVRDAESWIEWKAKGYGKTVRFVNGVHGLFEPFESFFIVPIDPLAITIAHAEPVLCQDITLFCSFVN